MKEIQVSFNSHRCELR